VDVPLVNIVLRNRKNTIVVPNMPNVDPTTVKQKKINPIVPASCQEEELSGRRRVVRKMSCQDEEIARKKSCPEEELSGRRVDRKKSCQEEESARKKKLPGTRSCQEVDRKKLTGRS